MTEIAVGAWSWDEQELRAAAASAAQLAVDHLVGLREQPVFRPLPRTLAEHWRNEEWGDVGGEITDVLDQIAHDVLAFPLGNGHPRFYGWVNSPPDRVAVLVSSLAAAANPSCAGGNHAAIHLERQVVRWLAEMIGLPAGAGGLLLSGASLATVTALAAARQSKAPFDVRCDGLAGQPPLTVYASNEAHSCVTKAVELLGLGSRNLRLLEAADDGTLNPALLERALAADGARGETPIAVIASAGTVSRGAIDPLDEIAAVCAERGLWLHVDGAYGAPAILTSRYRGELEGLAHADSVAVDPHKWLYVPVDAGVLLVRDPELLRDAFRLVPPYLRVGHDPDGVSDAPWLAEYGLEQTRPLRALRVWAAMKSTGRDGYRQLIEHDLELAAYLTERVSEHDELALVSFGLSVVCFRYGDLSDAGQSEVARLIQLGGEVFLTTAEVSGGTALRACFVNPLTTRDDVDALVELVTRTGRAVAARAGTR